MLMVCMVLSVEAQGDIWRSDSLQEVVVAFMGHGNPDSYDTFKANIRYTQLEQDLQKFSPNYFVGTVDMPDNSCHQQAPSWPAGTPRYSAGLD